LRGPSTDSALYQSPSCSWKLDAPCSVFELPGSRVVMGKRREQIAHICDKRSRRVTFVKRKGGLIKKATELSVLCNSEVLLIVFSPSDKMFVYSSSHPEATFQRFKEHRGPQEFLTNEDYGRMRVGQNQAATGHGHAPSRSADSPSVSTADDVDGASALSALRHAELQTKIEAAPNMSSSAPFSTPLNKSDAEGKFYPPQQEQHPFQQQPQQLSSSQLCTQHHLGLAAAMSLNHACGTMPYVMGPHCGSNTVSTPSRPACPPDFRESTGCLPQYGYFPYEAFGGCGARQLPHQASNCCYYPEPSGRAMIRPCGLGMMHMMHPGASMQQTVSKTADLLDQTSSMSYWPTPQLPMTLPSSGVSLYGNSALPMSKMPQTTGSEQMASQNGSHHSNQNQQCKHGNTNMMPFDVDGRRGAQSEANHHMPNGMQMHVPTQYAPPQYPAAVDASTPMGNLHRLV